MVRFCACGHLWTCGQDVDESLGAPLRARGLGGRPAHWRDFYVFLSALITRERRWQREHTASAVVKPAARCRPSVIIVVGESGAPTLEARHSAQT